MYWSCLFAGAMSLLPAALAQLVDPGLVQKLRSAPTHVDQISLLKDENVRAGHVTCAFSALTSSEIFSSSSTFSVALARYQGLQAELPVPLLQISPH